MRKSIRNRVSRACYRSLVTVSDTSPKFARLHLDLYRAASASSRAGIAVELSDAVRATTLAGIRHRHPDFSEEQIRHAFLRLVYGIGLP